MGDQASSSCIYSKENVLINRNSYLNAIPLAQEVDMKGLRLQARPSSVLGELVDLSTSFTTEQRSTVLPSVLANRPAGSMNWKAEDRALWVESMSSGLDGESQHTLKMRALVDDIAPYITNHISFARNVVAPRVTELAEKLQHYLTAAKPIDPVSLFEIESRDIPDLLKDESFMSGELLAYRDVTEVKSPTQTFVFATLEGQTTQAFVSLGSERLDELVGRWLMGLPKDYLDRVYQSYFVGQLGEKYYDYHLVYAHERTRNPYAILDLAIATYLIAKKLSVEVQSIPGVSLTQYKTELRNIIDLAGSKLWMALKSIARHIETGVMVEEAVVSAKRIVVNNAVYRPWLAEGNVPEVLLGMLASGQVNYSVRNINAVKDAMLKAWQGYVSLVQTDLRAEMKKRFTAYAEAEAIQGLAELSDLEKDYAQDHAGFKDEVVKRIKAEIADLGHRIMDNPNHTALHLVAKARFYFTSSYGILSEMEEAAKENPELDPREAALLSVVSYLADYFAEQVSAVK